MITNRAREILTQHGIDVNNLGDAPPLDVADVLTENATQALRDVIPSELAGHGIEQTGVADWVNRFLTDAPMPPLLILGPLGTGKTTHGYAALRECLLGRARQRRTLSWVMTSHAKFNAAMRPTSDDAHLAAFQRAEQAELLILDDVGASISTDWTADTLYRLIDERWVRRRATVLTSNFTPDQLEQKIDPRVVSRIACGEVVRLKGRDRRMSGSRR